ncbi:MAG: hypothetical protein QM778_22400 [Myxococcales bacterium]
MSALGRLVRMFALTTVGSLALTSWTACDASQPEVQACDGDACPKWCVELEGDDCDILRPSCRERLFKAVRCVRGVKGQLPNVRLTSEDQLRAEAMANSMQELPEVLQDAGPDAGDAGAPSEPSLEDHWNRALAMLGLQVAEPSMDEVDFLGGYYDSSMRSITLVDRGEPQDSPDKQRTLAHEFVHALQDQEIGLTEARRGRTGTTDASLAMGCLTEGEAVLYEELSWGLLRGLPVDRQYFQRVFERRTKYNRDAVALADSPYDASWLLRYGVGAQFVTDAWLEGGVSEVARLYDATPASTLQWMLGYRAAQEREEPLSLPLACIDGATPEGYERVRSDVFGAFVLYGFLSHNLVMNQLVESELSWERALAWRQDRVEIFAGPTGQTAVSWRMRFDDEATAEAIAQALENQHELALNVWRFGTELDVRAVSGTELPSWSVTDPAHCP